MANGHHYDVVAPTKIPSPRGKPIKTDRFDASQLAQFYAHGRVSLITSQKRNWNKTGTRCAFGSVLYDPIERTRKVSLGVEGEADEIMIQ